MVCPTSQAIAMSARLAPSTVNHVLRLVGTSYLDSATYLPSAEYRFRPLAISARRSIQSSRRFSSSANPLANTNSEPHLRISRNMTSKTINKHKPIDDRMVRPPLLPEGTPRLPQKAYIELFSREPPSAVYLQHVLEDHDVNPAALLAVQRLEAVFNIFSRPDTTTEDWMWLEDTLGAAMDTNDIWSSCPRTKAAVYSVYGLATAHAGDWDYRIIAKALHQAFNISTMEAPDDIVIDAVDEYVRIALRAGRAHDVARSIRFAGPKVHKLLSALSASRPLHPSLERLRTILHTALLQLDEPLDWLSSELDLGTFNGKPSVSVNHVAVAILASKLSIPEPNLKETFTYWKSISKMFNRTHIPFHLASVLALRLAEAREHSAAHIVLKVMRDRKGEEILPHKTLSRELWVYADQGKVEDAVRIWGDVNMLHGPIPFDNIALATAYAATGDIQRTLDTLKSLLGPKALSRLEPLSVLVRACIAADDPAEALRYLELSIAIDPVHSPYQAVLALYAARADVQGAIELFSRMISMGVTPSARCYIALIQTFAKVAHYVAAGRVFREMIAAGHTPNADAYAAVMDAAVRAAQWEVVADLAEKVPPPILHERAVVTVIIKALVAAGAPFKPINRLFRSLERPSARAWAMVMQSAMDNGNYGVARAIFTEMDERSQVDPFSPRPGVYIFSILMGGYLRIGDRDSARTVYDTMLARNLMPNKMTYGAITVSFANAPGETSFEQAHNFAMSVYDEAYVGKQARATAQVGSSVFSPLLVVAGRAGDLVRAKEYYDTIKEAGGTSIVTDSQLMDAYRKAGELKPVYRLWLRLFGRAKRTVPDARDPEIPQPIGTIPTRAQNNVMCIPLSIMIQMLGEAGLLERLKKLWHSVRESGFGRDAQNYNDYAAALAKTGDIEGAFHVVEHVLIPRQEEINRRYYRALRSPEGLVGIDPESVPDDTPDPEDDPSFPTWDPERQAEAINASEARQREALEEAAYTSDDAADAVRRTVERSNAEPPEEFTDDSQSSTAVGLQILRFWRPADAMWRPSRATVALLEQTYRQLEDQQAYRAWVGLGLGEEEAVDDGEPPAVLLPDFGTTVKNQDGTDKRITPQAMLARLNRRYARVVALIMFRRRKGRSKGYKRQRRAAARKTRKAL